MYHPKTRRAFLKTVAGMATAAPLVSRMPRIAAGTKPDFDPNFGTASDAVRAIRSGAISSRELTEHVYARIKKFNPQINAFITLIEEQAMARAKEADEALAAGKIWGPLHGLPILIKDVFSTAGVRTTSGSKMLENYVPKEDAVAVTRLKAAGAVILGKTNMPEFAGDLQSYNDIAGTTNNPWDLTRTPGGSTGGGAAALAAGMGFLELGSDIGGSIRTPSHFCGIYGLKPTLNLVPEEGHIPPPPGQTLAIRDLAVAGPLARSAQDLLLELEVIAGPNPEDATAYCWHLPAPRGARLKDYRIGYVLDDPFCPVPPEVRDLLTRAVDALRAKGVRLEEGWPAGIRPQEVFDNYILLLSALLGLTTKEEELKVLRESLDSPWGYYARMWLRGREISHAEWLGLSGERLKKRALWQEYFETHDAFLLPENIVPAFPHNHKGGFFERTVATPQGDRFYGDMLRWISFATLAGNPASVAPVGRMKDGLPVGIQIMGPYLEDATPVHIAGLMADVVGGFVPPPGYES
jgi:amidase